MFPYRIVAPRVLRSFNPFPPMLWWVRDLLSSPSEQVAIMVEARGLVQANSDHDKVIDINASRLNWHGICWSGLLGFTSCLCHRIQTSLMDPPRFKGDRIQCSIPKASFGEFIVQTPGRGVQTTSHKFRLIFYRKTSVIGVSMDAFPFSPFRITPFPGIVAVTESRQYHLIDRLGHVVGKEDVIDMQRRGLLRSPLSRRIQSALSLLVATVLNMNDKEYCWVLGNVVSIECGAKGWYYASCKNCYKNVEDKKDLYKRLNCDHLGYKPLLDEATLILGKIARDVKDANPNVDAATYPKMFDDILQKSSQRSMDADLSVSNWKDSFGFGDAEGGLGFGK
ncbi:hypothetical protein PIB30_072085 [Stylosanthes scabra]|uniref:Uncharacterized protein n=1 Tax=Stylosanthes scabra TaxID=79078 RepID=A0ABU6RNX3_9FABA|nr:hypothetical protein [Stylosanthes scabra]